MLGRLAVAEEMENWCISFEVADEAMAGELAAALSEYGFTLVDAFPDDGEGWT